MSVFFIRHLSLSFSYPSPPYQSSLILPFRLTSLPQHPDTNTSQHSLCHCTYSLYPTTFNPSQLQTILPSLYLSTVQVLELLLLFPDVNYLRVQVFVSVYSRILDLESTHAIFDEVLIFSFTLHSVNNCETLLRIVGIATSSSHQLLPISLEMLQAFKALLIYLDLHWIISIATLCSVFNLFSLHPFLIPWYPLLCFLPYLYIVIKTFAYHHICSPPTLFIPFRPLNSSSGVLRG